MNSRTTLPPAPRRTSTSSTTATEPLPGIEPAPLAPPRAPVEGDSHAGLLPPLEALARERGYGVAWLPRLDLARRIESRICHVNGSTAHYEPQIPFGGVTASRCARFGGIGRSRSSPSCAG